MSDCDSVFEPALGSAAVAPACLTSPAARATTPTYSIVIPVYNSAEVVGETLDRTAAFCTAQGWAFEIIAVNDGSRDQSWEVISQRAAAHPHIIAINLLRNYGQHTAVLCGIQQSRGAYVVTMDDDLQNPPEEIVHLVTQAQAGHDVVFGRYRSKQHAGYRRLGSRIIDAVNTRIFHKPADLTLSNFRLIRRDVVTRMLAYRTHSPYIQGLALMFAAHPSNVWVDHHPRRVGHSTYSTMKILQLVMRILFSYSLYPLRVVSAAGLGIAGVSFVLGLYYLARALLIGITIPGWATVVVLLSFFNGMTILIASMLGEYLLRLLSQTSGTPSYHISTIVRHEQEPQ